MSCFFIILISLGLPPTKGQVPKYPKTVFRCLSDTHAPRPLFTAAQHNDYKLKQLIVVKINN